MLSTLITHSKNNTYRTIPYTKTYIIFIIKVIHIFVHFNLFLIILQQSMTGYTESPTTMIINNFDP